MEYTLGGIFALVIGVAGAAVGVRQLGNRKALDGWPSTGGMVIERGTFKPEIPITTAPAFHYSPLVRYVYTVDGRNFECNHIYPKRMFAPPTNTEKWARKQAESFPDDVTVHFNPDDPSEAFLERVPRRWLFIFVASFSAVALFGILMVATGLVS
jgi:hypothetical protein